MQPEQQGFNARINGALRKPSLMASHSLTNLNDSYKEKRKKLASKSATNLNNAMQRQNHKASQSVCDLQGRTVAHTVALCDLISSKLDQVITSMDDEVFSGNEQELGMSMDQPTRTIHVLTFSSNLRTPYRTPSKL